MIVGKAKGEQCESRPRSTWSFVVRCALGATLVMLSCARTDEPAPASAVGRSPATTSLAANTPAPGQRVPPGPLAEGEIHKAAAKNSNSATATPQPAAYRMPAGERVVAIGDLHGDFEATVEILKLAGAIDDSRTWRGKTLTVVQTGDQLDRGDGERKIIDLFTSLAQQAAAAGGRFIVLNGNHEVMNVAGDFRYVTAGGLREFEAVTSSTLAPEIATQLPASAHGRATAFLPGGPYARILAERQIVTQVGETVFVHGGVLEKHIDYGIDRINREASEWMRGVRPAPSILASDDAPVWSRRYSAQADSAVCAELARVLLRMGAKRMVVGHTIQPDGVSSACNDRIWRIDVGMASHYGGNELAALEITTAGVRVLRQAKDSANAKPVERAVGQ